MRESKCQDICLSAKAEVPPFLDACLPSMYTWGMVNKKGVSKMELKTYEQVAEYACLGGVTRALFLAYMKRRWSKQEEGNSLCGYALEWAYRFRGGYEYEASDSEGQAVLRELSSVYK